MIEGLAKATTPLLFRIKNDSFYGRGCIIRNPKKIGSVEFGTVGPRPTFSFLFCLFATQTGPFMEGKHILKG